MKEVFDSNQFSSDSPQTRILQSLLFLQEKQTTELDKNLRQTMQQLLFQWIGLPRLPSAAHIPMLQSFHRIIELYESAKIIQHLSADSRTRHSKLGGKICVEI